MSFSKAKLQRFNEIANPTPSPADYNVSLNSRVAGAVISKSERFVEQPSPSHSDNGSITSSNSVPVFRTPNLPQRKIKIATSIERKIKPVPLFQTTDLEALNEKIVECNHKDLYIQDLTQQLDEMKQQLSDLKAEISHLSNDKQQLEENVGKLQADHESSIEELHINYRQEVIKLNEKFMQVNVRMDEMKTEYVKLKEANQKDLEDLLNNITTLEQLHTTVTETYSVLLNKKDKELEIKENQIEQLEKDRIDLQKSHTAKIEDLKQQHQQQREDIEFEMLKSVTNIQNQLTKEKKTYEKNLKEALNLKKMELDNLKKEFEQEILKLQSDSDAKVKQLTENYKETSMLAEMQMKEKCADIEIGWKLKLDEAKAESDAILKECQAIAEYNIIQTEIEKNKAVYDLSQLQKDFDLLQTENLTYSNMRNEYSKLKLELEKCTHELNVIREKLDKDTKIFNIKEEQLMRDKHTYEVTILKTHKTVETLKKRLMRSDLDVEQLKAELEATEECKLEFEGKCNQLVQELQIVCELCDDMEEQNKLALCVANEKITSLEGQLLNKVENFKELANQQVSSISKELNKKNEEVRDIMEHLHCQQKLNIEAQDLIVKSNKEIERLEEEKVQNFNKFINLELILSNLKEKLEASLKEQSMLKATNESLKSKNQKLEFTVEELTKVAKTEEENKTTQLTTNFSDLNKKYEALLQSLYEVQDENKKLKKKVAEQESLIGPFRAHLEAYEMEYNALMNQKQDAEKEAREMGMKYAEMLGHQNQKQKIKHLMDLKKKNYDLSENKKELETKVRTQARTIEKLKKELSCLTRSPIKLHQQVEDKENADSPSRALNSSYFESPGGPLRDRN